MATDRPHDRTNPHDTAAGAPGASGPGEPGYDGSVTIGDEGAAPEHTDAAATDPLAEEADSDASLVVRGGVTGGQDVAGEV